MDDNLYFYNASDSVTIFPEVRQFTILTQKKSSVGHE